MDASTLNFSNFERLNVARPVDRLAYIAEACRGKTVLDLGCLDETALVKRDTEYWLHGRIASVAKQVIGLDNSAKIPDEGIETGPTSRIHRGDVTTTDFSRFPDVEVIVAGEFIEHIEHPLAFLRAVQAAFPGRELILSTPNGAAFANLLMGTIGREPQHPDHILSFTYKTLHTVCARAGFREWDIIPCKFYAHEMILNSTGAVRLVATVAQAVIQAVTYLFPLTASSYIVRARLSG